MGGPLHQPGAARNRAFKPPLTQRNPPPAGKIEGAEVPMASPIATLPAYSQIYPNWTYDFKLAFPLMKR
jgi:hypothetical protein